MNLQDLHFGLYSAAYLLLGVFLFLSFFWNLAHYRQKILNSFAKDSLISKIIIQRSSYLSLIKAVAFCLAWVFGVLAFMQPQGNGRYPQTTENLQPGSLILKRKAHEVSFLIDTSASMSVTDTRNKKSRLDYAKEIVDEVISLLTGETVSLYAFTTELVPLVPATNDYIFTRIVLSNIQINEGGSSGTDLIKALKEINQIFLKNSPSISKTLLLFSDGGDVEQSAPSSKNPLESSDLFSKNVRTFSIGMGSSAGVDILGIVFKGKPVHTSLQSNLLKQIALKGGGAYYEANDYTPYLLAKEIISKIAEEDPYLNPLSEKTRHSAGSLSLIYDLYFQIPLGLAILMLILYLFLPDSLKSKNTEEFYD